MSTLQRGRSHSRPDKLEHIYSIIKKLSLLIVRVHAASRLSLHYASVTFKRMNLVILLSIVSLMVYIYYGSLKEQTIFRYLLNFGFLINIELFEDFPDKVF